MKINLMNVKSVVSVFVKVQACGAIAKFKLEKSHLNVKSVELFLAKQDTLGDMKGFYNGEKPYEALCKQCGKCFSRSDDLSRLARKTYDCKQRGKCFNLSRDLRVHQKIHSTNMSHKRDSSKRLCKQTGSNTRSNRSRITNKSISQRKTRDKCKEGVESAVIEKQSCWICQEEISSQALLVQHYENHMRHVAEEDS